MTTLKIALDYIERGWSPVPIPYKEKAPIIKGWPALRISAETAPDYFKDQQGNIGVLMGDASNGLVDIDLDCPEAIRLAKHFLPPTATFGRDSGPRAHWLYKCENAGQRVAFEIKSMGMVAEFRANGSQTMFPGSTHPEGEVVRWDDNRAPAEIDAGELKRSVATLSAASVLMSHWVEGTRDDLATALAGFLLRSRWKPEDVDTLIEYIASAAGDDVEARLKAIRLARSMTAGKHVPGFPRLREIIGDDAEKVREWLVPEQRADDWPISIVSSANDLLARDIPEQEWLVDGFLLSKTWAQIAGWRGVGKTTLTTTLALAIARGERFLFWDIPKPQRVLYVDGEMSLSGFKRTLNLVSGGEDCGLLDLMLSEDFHGIEKCPFTLNNETHQERFLTLLKDLEVRGRRPAVIIFDNLSSMTSGLDENSNSDQDAILKLMSGLRHEGYTIIQIHHTGKGGDQRGASRREDALDLSIKLTPPDVPDPMGRAKFTFTFTKTRGMLTPKQNGFDAVLTSDGWATNMKPEKKQAKWLQVLKLIADNKPQTQKEIAEAFGVTDATVSGHITTLRKKGFLGEGLTVTHSAERYLAKAYGVKISVDDVTDF